MDTARGPSPLVSIIVRSMGRPSLRRALDSVAAQTHRPVEVVLVDAKPSGIVLERHGDLCVRVVGGRRLPRAEAANVGLEAANGQWMMFLDEDDTIAPEHVQSLVATAENAHAPVAYSQTLLVDRAGTPQRLLGGPFRRDLLKKSNYLAIHAVLFAWALVDSGARFDVSWPMFEDWDFWLQLSEHVNFAFTGKPTAFYRMEDGTSGAGGGINLDRTAVLGIWGRLMDKWRNR